MTDAFRDHKLEVQSTGYLDKLQNELEDMKNNKDGSAKAKSLQSD